jgi:hypothetical protein
MSFIPERYTLSKEMEVEIICHLRDAVRRKYVEKWT